MSLKTLLQKVPSLQDVQYFEEIDSTNAEALRQVRTEPKLLIPKLLVAKRQSAGRGRLQRKWNSPAGHGLYVSLLCAPKIAPAKIPLLSLTAGLALAKSLKSLNLPAQLKWPNDILITNRKVAGILCEMHGNPQTGFHVVVGLGLNLTQKVTDFPKALQTSATSLAEHVSKPKIKNIDPLEILCTWLQNFFGLLNHLENDEGPKIISQWEQHCPMIGKTMRIQMIQGDGPIKTGILLGLNEHGHLRLQDLDGKIESLAAGDVTHVP